jgi:hypothetical protein
MTKSILAVMAFTVLASSGVTATEIVRKTPLTSKVYPTTQSACWWDPPIYYRNYAYFSYYPYDDPLRPASGCHNAYYAPRWSGYHWNLWTMLGIDKAITNSP